MERPTSSRSKRKGRQQMQLTRRRMPNPESKKKRSRERNQALVRPSEEGGCHAAGDRLYVQAPEHKPACTQGEFKPDMHRYYGGRSTAQSSQLRWYVAS